MPSSRIRYFLLPDSDLCTILKIIQSGLDDMAIIALINGSYCHGKDLAGRITHNLGYRNISDELFQTASDRFNVSRERLIRSLTGPQTLIGKLTKESDLNPIYLETVLAELMLSDNIVITNHPAYLVPGYIANILKICIIANQNYRIEQAVLKESVSEESASELIQEYDTAMSYAANMLQDTTAYDKDLFDIVIPMHATSLDEALEQICTQAQSDQLKTSDEVKIVAMDFLLSSKIKLAIAQAGHVTNVFSENGRVVIHINEQSLFMGKLESKLKNIAKTIPGVTDVITRLGSKFEPPSLNPWQNVNISPKIMLVDDEKEFVHTLSERLKTRNFESSIAYDGEQAIEMLNHDVPDVMVLDLMMPGIDGIETLRRVKNTHPKIEIIILTGHGSDAEQEAAEELGAYAYLRKPVAINELAKKMKEAYAHQRRGK